MNSLWHILAAYVIGSIPFGYLACRLIKGQDVRTTGSGSIGATNVRRLMGMKWFIAIMILDTAKGFAAVYLAKSIGYETDLLILIGLSAIFGHVFPFWLKFKGGKGVATTLGVALALCPEIGAATFGVWLFVLVLTRYMSVASVFGAITLTILSILYVSDTTISLLFSLIAALVVIKHIPNLRRLDKGVEPKFSFKGGEQDGCRVSGSSNQP